METSFGLASSLPGRIKTYLYLHGPQSLDDLCRYFAVDATSPNDEVYGAVYKLYSLGVVNFTYEGVDICEVASTLPASHEMNGLDFERKVHNYVRHMHGLPEVPEEDYVPKIVREAQLLNAIDDDDRNAANISAGCPDLEACQFCGEMFDKDECSGCNIVQCPAPCPTCNDSTGCEDCSPTQGTPATVLDEAMAVTSGDRRRDYGHPIHNFQRIADFWNTFLHDKLKDGEFVMPEDTAQMMILVKVAREMNTPKRDNLVDICGYARTIEMMSQYREDLN